MHGTICVLLVVAFGVNVLDAQDCILRNQAIGECRRDRDCPEVFNNIMNRFGEPSVPIRCSDDKVCCRVSSVTESTTEEQSPWTPPSPTPPRKSKPTKPVNKPSRGNERKVVAVCKEYADKRDFAVNTQIYNGRTVLPGQFPHMAALGYPDEEKGGLKFDCGGTLISETFVLTAAHCLIVIGGSKPTVVRLGVIQLNGEIDTAVTDYPVEQDFVHESYDRIRKSNDIALLRLARRVTFGTNLYPACLHTDASNPDPDTTLYITGWGKINANAKESNNVLLMGEVAAVKTEDCNRVYNNSDFRRKYPDGYLSSQLCAKDPKPVRSDTCPVSLSDIWQDEGDELTIVERRLSRSNIRADVASALKLDPCNGIRNVNVNPRGQIYTGDSGGPLQMALDQADLYSVVGITSYGRKCGIDIPGIYTRVSSYLDWIESIVWP